MSKLDDWIDICRTGTWIDHNRREVKIDLDRLDRFVAEFDAGDPPPVVIGHPAENDPAYGVVARVRRTGDRLQAQLGKIEPAFRKAVEAGRYFARSISFSGNRIIHLGFLGARRPAVDGLRPAVFSSRPETVICFNMPDGTSALGARLRALLDEQGKTIGDLAEAMKVSESTAAQILSGDIARPPDERLQGAADLLDVPVEELRSLIPEGMLAAPADNAWTSAELAEERARLDARRVLDDARRDVARHVAAGRLLPRQREPVVALMAALRGNDTEIRFAAPDEEGVHSLDAEWLDNFLSELPVQVHYNEFATGPLPTPAEAPSAEVAGRAQKLMADASAAGDVLPLHKAIERARSGTFHNERSA